MKYGKYRKNTADDGLMPCCASCQRALEEDCDGGVKNYPQDGLVAVFLTCAACGTKSGFYYQPYKPEVLDA